MSHCSLNFECPHLGYGFLSIILVLEKCSLGPWKVLEFCTKSLLRTLQLFPCKLCADTDVRLMLHMSILCLSAFSSCFYVLINTNYMLLLTECIVATHVVWVPLHSNSSSLYCYFCQTVKQTVYWILAASKGWIKQTYRKIMHTQNHITGNALVQIE